MLIGKKYKGKIIIGISNLIEGNLLHGKNIAEESSAPRKNVVLEKVNFKFKENKIIYI